MDPWGLARAALGVVVRPIGIFRGGAPDVPQPRPLRPRHHFAQGAVDDLALRAGARDLHRLRDQALVDVDVGQHAIQYTWRVQDVNANYPIVTRANLRLPTCTTYVPAASFSPLSLTGDWSTRTPPPSIRRLASEVEGASPACFSSCAMPSGAPDSVTSGISSGTPPLLRLTKSCSAASAAAASWKRAVISLASSTLASRGFRPPS